jgi:hypothetical protein
MKPSNIFEQVQNKRKKWTPITPVDNEYASVGAEDTINRCLALRVLELPVREFIQEGLNKLEKALIGDIGVQALLRNVEDEEKHDTALNNIVNVYPDYKKNKEKIEKEASIIAQAWILHPDFPITKAAVLENGIFFVILPLYRFYGGSALRTSALDISSDEVNHVQSHREAARLSNYRPSSSLDKLRKDTINWIIQNFNVKGYDRAKLMKASDDLMYKGITDQLNFTQTYTQLAFFEKPLTKLPSYS